MTAETNALRAVHSLIGEHSALRDAHDEVSAENQALTITLAERTHERDHFRRLAAETRELLNRAYDENRELKTALALTRVQRDTLVAVNSVG